MTSHKQQRGVTLILALIMLVVSTMIVLSSFNIGLSSLQVVDNFQQRSQALNAAQTTLDTVISDSTFTDTTATVLSNANCPSTLGAAINTTCVDVYGDSKTVLQVALLPAPTCAQTKAVNQASLDLSNSEDLGCVVGISNNFGLAGAGGAGSLCSDSLWEVNVVATEPKSNAKATVTEGIAIRVSTDKIATTCP